jgi:hypothetical protein
LSCQAKQRPYRRLEGFPNSTDVKCADISRRDLPQREWRRSTFTTIRRWANQSPAKFMPATESPCLKIQWPIAFRHRKWPRRFQRHPQRQRSRGSATECYRAATTIADTAGEKSPALVEKRIPCDAPRCTASALLDLSSRLFASSNPGSPEVACCRRSRTHYFAGARRHQMP